MDKKLNHRPIRCCGIVQTWFGLAFVALLSSARADDVVKIEPLERWSTVFPDSETRWNYLISSDNPLQGRGAWKLTMNHQTLARGEFPLNEDDKKIVTRTIRLQWPKIEAGVTSAMQFTVTAGQSRHERAVWVLPHDPFIDRHEWLNGLKLKLF